MYTQPFNLQWNELATNGSGSLDLATDDGDVTCQIGTADRLACELEKLSYYSERIGGASIEQLEALGTELCRRVTYLMEPLGLIEIDRSEGTVQLRSTPPAQYAEGVRYFEASISAGRGLSLQRFEAPRRQQRVAISATVTKETLERLIADCTGATKELL